MINIIKDIEVLLEDFKFKPRKIQGREEQRFEVKVRKFVNLYNKFKSLLKEYPIETKENLPDGKILYDDNGIEESFTLLDYDDLNEKKDEVDSFFKKVKEQGVNELWESFESLCYKPDVNNNQLIEITFEKIYKDQDLDFYYTKKFIIKRKKLPEPIEYKKKAVITTDGTNAKNIERINKEKQKNLEEVQKLKEILKTYPNKITRQIFYKGVGKRLELISYKCSLNLKDALAAGIKFTEIEVIERKTRNNTMVYIIGKKLDEEGSLINFNEIFRKK